jgi:uncharacterized OB-fold protein
VSEKPLPEISAMNRDYFEGCTRGELRLRRCLRCAALFRFAHDWCPSCWSADLGWERASGRGRVTHFTVVHQAPSKAFQADAPYVLALVELEEGVRLMTTLVDCAPDAARIGLEVTVEFEPRGNLALPVFRPVAAASPA